MKRVIDTTGAKERIIALVMACTIFGTVPVSANAAEAWQIEVVDPVSHIDGYTSLALDSLGKPHVAYTDRTNGELKYAQRTDTGWSIRTVDPDVYLEAGASLALDSSTRPHLAYYNYYPDSGVKYAWHDGGAWHIEAVGQSKYPGYAISPTALALDASGNPHIAHAGYDDYSLKYAYRDGTSWQTELVDGSGQLGLGISLAVDSSGKPHIAYTTRPPYYDLKYAYRNGGSWTVEIVRDFSALGRDCSLVLDSSDRPHISCYGDSQLRYALRNGATWEIRTVDADFGAGQMSSIALDGLGRVHISYCYDSSSDDLRYAYYDGSSWQIETVDFEGIVGQHTSLGLDSSNRPHISYEDDTNHKLKYATRAATNHPPTADAGPDQTVEATDPGGAEVTLDSSASTDDGQLQPLTYEWTWAGRSATGVNPTVTFPLGTTTVTLTVFDGEFFSNDTVDISVADTTPPTIVGPADITVEAQDAGGVPATDSAIQEFLNGASATDTCDSSPAISTDAPPLFPIGQTTVTFTAMDASGNASTCQATVTVTYEEPPEEDTAPPEILSLTADPSVLWPANHKMVAVAVTVECQDDCDPNPVCMIADVTCNEPVNGSGDGHTSLDWEITGDLTVLLRAESAGTGIGRVYTITIECTDASGNAAVAAVEVTVPHDQGEGNQGKK